VISRRRRQVQIVMHRRLRRRGIARELGLVRHPAQAGTGRRSRPEGPAVASPSRSPEGRNAVCVWEADSIATLKDYLDPMLGPSAKNDYTEVVNKEGVALPRALQLT
jgi:hypothetical protein